MKDLFVKMVQKHKLMGILVGVLVAAVTLVVARAVSGKKKASAPVEE